jgi:hypothetical protein
MKLTKNEHVYEAKMWAVVWKQGTTKEYRHEGYRERPRTYMPITGPDPLNQFQYLEVRKKKGKKVKKRLVYGSAEAIFDLREEARAFVRSEGYSNCFCIRPVYIRVVG